MPRIEYQNFPGFDQVYLEDSFVLGIETTQHSAELMLEVVLRERHPLYQHPKAGEQYSYRRGSIRFPGAVDVRWIRASIRPSVDAAGDVDFGNIDALYRESGKYGILGDWGELAIVSDAPEIEFPDDAG